ncbi:diacylglycerol kinase family lipid kinase [Niallia oryzisoli]|uniref:Diacylglycerol kinase family lipid kinase n=1 Tax=Niallia oryzisoli TaxID=1737571 RepID=A0ABZ2CKH1_9BACI
MKGETILKKYYYIINEAAGNGRAKQTWEKIKRLLDNYNIQYQSYFSKYPSHPEVIAKEIAQSVPGKIAAIIAVGGDGTIHEVINGLKEYSNVKFGFIPTGSGNDFARGFLIPRDPEKALEFILSFDEQLPRIDVGSYHLNHNQEKSLFINNLGVGFDAEVSLEANKSRIKKWLNRIGIGSLTYVAALLEKAITFRPSDVMLTIDDREHHFPNVWFITISNQAYYGGGMKISPSAIPIDGLLNITVVHQLSKLKLLLVFISVFFGKHTKLKEVRTLTGKKITITSKEPMKVHADGEIVGESPVDIEVLPSYMHIYSKIWQ